MLPTEALPPDTEAFTQLIPKAALLHALHVLYMPGHSIARHTNVYRLYIHVYMYIVFLLVLVLVSEPVLMTSEALNRLSGHYL